MYNRDPFTNYDQWLERPYQDMMAEADYYMDWCEDNDLDPDDPATEELFQASEVELSLDWEDYADQYEDEDWDDYSI